MESIASHLRYAVQIKKKADDAAGIPRVSLGGSIEMGGFYCVYRGDKQQAIACLKAALYSMVELANVLGDKEPDLSPDDGKVYS